MKKISILKLNNKKRILLADILGVDQSELINLSTQKFQLELDEKNFQLFRKKEKLLDQNYPLDYLLSKIKILNLNLKILPDVFIPRDETEEWLKNLNKLFQKPNFKHKTLVDLCSGSGIIGIYLSKNFKQVLSIDVDIKAIQNTNLNKSLNKVKNLRTFQSNLFKNPKLRKKTFNLKSDWILICNPPYVPSVDQNSTQIQKNNLYYEPNKAIFSGKDGLDFFKKIYFQLKELDKQSSLPETVIFELDPRNIQKAQKYLNKIYKKTLLLKDFNGYSRVLVGTKAKNLFDNLT